MRGRAERDVMGLKVGQISHTPPVFHAKSCFDAPFLAKWRDRHISRDITDSAGFLHCTRDLVIEGVAPARSRIFEFIRPIPICSCIH
jgi:hypothetical protein